MGEVAIVICDGSAGMRYSIPSQVRPAIHSIAASTLKTCQRVIPSMNVSVETKIVVRNVNPHSRTSSYTTCRVSGSGTKLTYRRKRVHVRFGSKADIG